CQIILSFVRKLNFISKISDSAEQFGQADVDDLVDILFGQGVEHNNIIQSVEELRAERLLQRTLDRGFHHFIHALLFRLGCIAYPSTKIFQISYTDVGGHDDDGVSEINPSA